MLLGQTDKLTGLSDTSDYVWLQQAFPPFAQAKDYGAFDEVNVEELVQDAPDVIISPANATSANEKMRSLDLLVLVDSVAVSDESDVFEQAYNEIDLVARLT
ncbi:MAG: ABC transporter substrate-binding protein [Beutenbergiaceae bacterium]